MPRLSIITINYNNAEGLLKTFASVFAQDFTDVEYLVIDGGSTDSSRQAIEANARNITYWVSERDAGIYHAMNKGIEKAKGEYLMFLNSGDFLLNDRILANAFDCIHTGRADIYYGNIQLEERDLSVKFHSYPQELTLDFWEHYTINHQAAFIKASLFNELGHYSAGYPLAADYAFFLKCFVNGKQFKKIDLGLVHYKLDGESSLNIAQYQDEMKKAWRELVHHFIQILLKGHQDHELLMKHRLMQWAVKLQRRYAQLKKVSFK